MYKNAIEFLKTVLLKELLYIMIFTYLKYTIQWFLVNLQVWKESSQSSFHTFLSPLCPFVISPCTVMLWKIEGRRRKGTPRMRWLDVITDSIDLSLSKLQEMVPCKRKWQPTPVFLLEKSHGQRSLMGTVHGVAQTWGRVQLSIWTTTTHPHS